MKEIGNNMLKINRNIVGENKSLKNNITALENEECRRKQIRTIPIVIEDGVSNVNKGLFRNLLYKFNKLI